MVCEEVEARLQRLAQAAAHTFQLPVFRELIFVDSAKENEFGQVVDWEAGDPFDIEVRVYRLRTRETLALPTIIHTLAHELAHLAEWNHTKKHVKLTNAIKIWLERNWDRTAFKPITARRK